jgi:hypothetical protein
VAFGMIVASPEKKMIVEVAGIHEFIEVFKGIGRGGYVEKE